MNKEKMTSVLIVDDHEIVRHGLRNSLEKEGSIKVVAEASDGRSAVEKVRTCNPDIVLMDINMPDLNGMEATKKILAENSKAKVIALSMHNDHLYIMGMLNAGASGFILKTCSYRELCKAIHTVMDGKVYLCPDICDVVIKRAIDPSSNTLSSTFAELSGRDIEVLQLIAEGKTSQEIADCLKISKRTVDIHRSNLKKKLNIDTVAEMTKLAVREGLTSLY